MDFKIFYRFCFLALFSIQAAGASPEKGPVAVATISHRVSKPGQHLELLITLRNALPPVSALPECPAGLEVRRSGSPQHVKEGGNDVWLLKFKIIPKSVGSFEIPPIRVSDQNGSVFTKPVILYVSNDARPPQPDARELALTTDIPLALAEEAVKTCPSPSPKPVSSPTPTDTRPLSSRLLNSVARGIIWFWNYPGK